MRDKFHQYRLSMELATKHSHSTYLACMTEDSEHQVVLVVFSSPLFSFPHEREHLLQKAQRIKKLQYQYFVPILDMGIEEDQPFVVYKYLPNGSLRNYLKNNSVGHLELQDALTIVLQVGEALVYAHEHAILHGNLKPENILFDPNRHCVLTDFYLMSSKDALIRDQAKEEYAFYYMAPEQFVGIYDARGDQYALGCLAYELITGHVPFAEQSLEAIMRRPREAQPAPLSESVADLPPSLEAAVFRTLAKDPDERFFDCSLFLDIIRSVLSSLSSFPASHSKHSHRKKSISRPIRLEGTQNAQSSSTLRARELFPTVKANEDEIPRDEISKDEILEDEISEDEIPKEIDTSLITEAPIAEQAEIISLAEPQESVLPSSFTFFAGPIGLGGPEDDEEAAFASQIREISPVLRVNESEISAKVDASLITETSMSEEARAIFLTTESPPSLPTETFWITKSLVEQEANKLFVEASASSIHGLNEDATAEMTSSLMVKGSSGVNSPLVGLTRHGRRKHQGLLILCLIIITLLSAYAGFLTSRAILINRSSTTVHQTEAASQTFVPVIEELPTPTPTPTPALVFIPMPTPTLIPTPTATSPFRYHHPRSR